MRNVPFASAVRASVSRLGDEGSGVVAVSGGADSVALLRALADDSPPGGLVIAPLHHRLRGADSEGDADFVSHLCPQFPHHIASIDVAAAAADRAENLESAARRLRYEFLEKVAHETGASW